MSQIPDKAAARRFRELIAANPADENALQSFLEMHTAFIETPGKRHHGLHLNCVISKLSVGPWKTDFAYLSKSTNGWTLALVELERPDKYLFREKNNHLAPTVELTTAVAQIDTWRDELKRNSAAIFRDIEPILVPIKMRKNPMTVEYVLIMGRDSEIQSDEMKKHRLDAYREEKKITILTYDTLLRTYEEGRGYQKCVLAQNARGFRIKNLDGEPGNIFSYVEQHHLEVSPEIERQLVDRGFDIPSWRNGEMLSAGGKRTMEEDLADLEDSLRRGGRKRDDDPDF